MSGLKVDMLDARVGRCSESCCGTGVGASLPFGVCPSAFSSTTSRTKPKTRLTMFPTTTSRGCAEVKRLPTWRMRSTSFAASRPLNSPTTRNSSAVVAMAHGLEFRICRRLSSLGLLILECAHMLVVTLRYEMPHRRVYWSRLERFQKRRQTRGLYYCRLSHGVEFECACNF